MPADVPCTATGGSALRPGGLIAQAVVGATPAPAPEGLEIVIAGAAEGAEGGLRLYMNDPTRVFEVTVHSPLGSASAAELEVELQCDVDPGNAQASKSHSPPGGAPLGKRSGDPAWSYLLPLQGAAAEVLDETKLRLTISAQGPSAGVARATFAPSAVGGDAFTLRAILYRTQTGGRVELERVELGGLRVWRRVSFDRLYSSPGTSHLDALTQVPEIQPVFTPGYVNYERGPVQPLPESLAIEYIGLYRADGDHRAWPDDLSPQSLESHPFQLRPTPEELAALEDPGAKAAASATIHAKAQEWYERVIDDMYLCVTAWFEAVTATLGDQHVIIGMPFLHPKYTWEPSANTNYWPADVRIRPRLANHTMKADRWWSFVPGVHSSQHPITVVFSNQHDTKTARSVCRHEIGHATRDHFPRALFGHEGVGGDHSDSGLMGVTAKTENLSPQDLRIIRGYAPGSE